jgi:hypothetical protein
MSRPPSRQMGREVEITIVIKAFRGDPMPTMDRIPSSGGTDGGGGEEGEEDADQEKEEPVPPPTLEELECR